MAKTRPPCPPEFRERMIELVRAGKSAESLGREYAQPAEPWLWQPDLLPDGELPI